MNKREVFVRLSIKNISEIKSHIVDKNELENRESGRYIMCAGKYDKNGWTIVFKAKDYKEAEYIINHTQFNNGKIYSNEIIAPFPRILC
ncbi:hypothetical protein [Clostridium sp. SHJSY1]|uniref:hypothetical protein n=1 Tax=Clostridium sp. SHJSY1 TaxID=2942483 RepID=UPI00287B7CE5|nr:hypothetical protein [Clostridium sp. SHJSY1]